MEEQIATEKCNFCTLNEFTVSKLLAKCYGINCKVIKELYSFEDRIFYIKNSKGTSEEDNCDEEFVFKVINAEDSKNPDVYEVVSKALVQLRKSGCQVQQPIPNMQNTFVTNINFDVNGTLEQHLLILLSYLPGLTLGEVVLFEENFNGVVMDTSTALAKINKQLTTSKFCGKSLNRMNSPWKIENFTEDFILQRSRFIKDADLQVILSEALKKFHDDVLPLLPHFRQAIIHNDVNCNNVIVVQVQTNNCLSCSETKEAKDIPLPMWKLYGLIDFGELVESKYLFEIATFLAYTVMKAEECGFDKNTSARYALIGYQKEVQLTKEERDCLYLAVVARLCILICLMHTLHQDTVNASSKPLNKMAQQATALLKNLWSGGEKEVTNKWMNKI